MRVSIHANQADHQRAFAALMASGLCRHGIEVQACNFDTPGDGDFAVVWGWRQRGVIEDCAARGAPVLVMERGHIHPRMEWTSLGWDGLAGRGRYPECMDGGERFEREHAHHLAEWRIGDGYVLVIGQTPGDASIEGVDFNAWRTAVENEIAAMGLECRYRHHPNVRATRPLADDLAGAGLVVTFNSTTGIEAVLAGVPTITMDRGAMAWPVSSHSLTEPIFAGDRREWCNRLAWAQWRDAEIEDGTAWEAVRTCMDT